ncbi:interleukin-like EMT inducer domain-containing protein [Candidatus Hydrogenedentota bacterium]
MSGLFEKRKTLSAHDAFPITRALITLSELPNTPALIILCLAILCLGLVFLPSLWFVVSLLIALTALVVLIVTLEFPLLGMCLFFVYATAHPTLRPVFGHYTNLPNILFSVWQEFLVGLMLLGTFHRLPWKQVKFHTVDWCVLALVFLAPLSFLVSRDLLPGIYAFRMTYMPMFFYFIVRGNNPDDKQASRLLVFLTLLLLVIALSGIALRYVFSNQEKLLYEVVRRSMEIHWHSIRMGSIFYSAVWFSALMAVGATICMTLVLRKGTGFTIRIMWGLAGLTFCFCVVKSISRGAWISIFVGFLVVLALAWRRGLLAMAFLCALVAFILLGDPGVAEKAGLTGVRKAALSTLEPLKLNNNNPSARTQFMRESFRHVVSNPLGFGLGGAGHPAMRFNTDGLANGAVAALDCWYLKVMAETGIHGLIVFLVFLAAASLKMLHTWRHGREGPGRWISLGILAAFLGVAARSAGSNVLDFYFVAPLVWCLLGIACSIESPRQTSERAALLPQLQNIFFRGKLWMVLLLLSSIIAEVTLAAGHGYLSRRMEENPHRYHITVPNLLEGGNIEAAQRVLNAARAIQPAERLVAYHMAEVHLSNDDPVAALTETLRMGLEMPVVQQIRDFRIAPPPSTQTQQELVGRIEESLSSLGELSPDHMTKLAIAYGRTGMAARALILFEEVRAAIPDAETSPVNSSFIRVSLSEILFQKMAGLSKTNNPPSHLWDSGKLASVLELSGATRVSSFDFQGQTAHITASLIAHVGPGRIDSSISLNGIKTHRGAWGRLGYMILIFDSVTGRTQWKNLHVSNARLLDQIRNAPDGDFVLILCNNPGWRSQILSSYGREAISMIGGNPDRARPRGSAWAVLGIKGLEPGKAAEVVVSAGDGPLVMFSLLSDEQSLEPLTRWESILVSLNHEKPGYIKPPKFFALARKYFDLAAYEEGFRVGKLAIDSLPANNRSRSAGIGSYGQLAEVFFGDWQRIPKTIYKNLEGWTSDDVVDLLKIAGGDVAYEIGADQAIPADIIAFSGGRLDGDKSRIIIGGEDVSLNKRGYNVVVLDNDNRTVKTAKSFDPFAASPQMQEMVEFFKGIPDGAVVICSIRGSGLLELTSGMVKSFQSVGAIVGKRFHYRNSYSLIGVKGSSPGSALELVKNCEKGPAAIALIIKDEKI